MVKVATKFKMEDPYSIPYKGPVPRIDMEEGLPPGALNLSRLEDWRKNVYSWHEGQKWYEGLKWHERLHAHATLSSARRNVKCKRPFEPKDELDFVLSAAYCPMKDAFYEKGDPYIQPETAFGEDMNLEIYKNRRDRAAEAISRRRSLYRPQWPRQETYGTETWRLLRNRVFIFPDRVIQKDNVIVYSTGGVERRENIHNVKLGIAADHSPQTNPGYSRTPSGAFYSI